MDIRQQRTVIAGKKKRKKKEQYCPSAPHRKCQVRGTPGGLPEFSVATGARGHREEYKKESGTRRELPTLSGS